MKEPLRIKLSFYKSQETFWFNVRFQGVQGLWSPWRMFYNGSNTVVDISMKGQTQLLFLSSLCKSFRVHKWFIWNWKIYLDNMVHIRKWWVRLDFLKVTPDTHIKLNVESEIVTPLANRLLHNILSIQWIRYTLEVFIQTVRGLHLQIFWHKFNKF